MGSTVALPLGAAYTPLRHGYSRKLLRPLAFLNAHLQVYPGLGGKRRNGLRAASANRAVNTCCALRIHPGRLSALTAYPTAIDYLAVGTSRHYCNAACPVSPAVVLAKPRHAGGGMHWPNPHGTAAFADEPSTPDGHSAEQQPRLRPSSFGRKALRHRMIEAMPNNNEISARSPGAQSHEPHAAAPCRLAASPAIGNNHPCGWQKHSALRAHSANC